MMGTLKISVIVPVYKVEPYLRRCVESVLTQTYRNLELILVDDGSPDNCPQLCDEYALKDARVKVLHKENGGLSDARNAGMKLACGSYVMFLDSDDFWNDTDALRRLAERIRLTNPDILNYSYVKYYPESGEAKPQFSGEPAFPIGLTKAQQLEELTARSLYIASACNKLIRRETVLKLSFVKGEVSEDIVWCAKLLTLADSFDFVCENFYYYRQRSASITHSMNAKTCTDLKNNILACLSVLEESRPETREALTRYTAYQYATFLAVQAMADACPPECISELAPYTWLLKHHAGSRKLKVLHLGCAVVGFRNLCRLIRATKRIWE